ncbi:unnamed protein product [Staurois parvus]|uniref:Uncharacterized protein n=1 Tax=Staurois parvus TaxID=386267 RepID=A0ABN9BJ94_9NEOB|nr:unnamed protein product [Staurois parvus]
MYINGRTGALQERVAVYKHPPLAPPVRAPWECVAPRSGAHCVLRRTKRNTDRCTGPLCEVLIM